MGPREVHGAGALILVPPWRLFDALGSLSNDENKCTELVHLFWRLLDGFMTSLALILVPLCDLLASLGGRSVGVKIGGVNFRVFLFFLVLCNRNIFIPKATTQRYT